VYIYVKTIGLCDSWWTYWTSTRMAPHAFVYKAFTGRHVFMLVTFLRMRVSREIYI